MENYNFKNEGRKVSLLLANKKRPDGSVYVPHVFKVESEVRKAVNDYLSDIMLEPEQYVTLPTAKTLDYSRFFRKYTHMDMERINSLGELRSLLNITRFQKSLLDAKNNGTLYRRKLDDAAVVSKRRINAIKRIAEYLHANDQFRPSESVQMINCAMKFHISVDYNGASRLSNIKNTNQHNIMPLVGNFALKVQKYLRQGLNSKKSFHQGFIDYKKNIQEEGMMLNMELGRQGWVYFPKSSVDEDVFNLQQASTGSDWCIEHDFELATDHLSAGDFWFYFEGSAAEIAVYISDNGMESFGRGPDQTLEGKYELIAERFIDKYNDSSFFDDKGDIRGDEYVLNDQERLFLKDIISSISSGVLTNRLLKYAQVELQNKKVKLKLPSEISTFIAAEMLEQLPDIHFEDIIESHSDKTITIHASVCVKDNREILNKIIEVKGNLEMSRLSEIEMPHLKRIGGYLDVRNAEALTFSGLEEVSGIIDAVGSRNINIPRLKRSQQYICSYYDKGTNHFYD